MTADWVGQQLGQIHGYLRGHFPGIERLAIALYEPETDKLKTFAHSTAGETPLASYEAPLSGSPSLGDLARSGRDRVIGDLSRLQASAQEHTRRLIESGYQSSYTVPVQADGRLFAWSF